MISSVGLIKTSDLANSIEKFLVGLLVFFIAEHPFQILNPDGICFRAFIDTIVLEVRDLPLDFLLAAHFMILHAPLARLGVRRFEWVLIHSYMSRNIQTRLNFRRFARKVRLG